MSTTGIPIRADEDAEGASSRDSPRNPAQIRERMLNAAAYESPDDTDLIRLYHQLVPAEELLGDLPVDLAQMVGSHRELAQQRVPGTSLLRSVAPINGTRQRETTAIEVVTDDMPCLLDSLTAELTRHDVRVQRVVHPVVVVRRDDDGALLEVLAQADVSDPPAGTTVESWIRLEIDAGSSAEQIQHTLDRLDGVLARVRRVAQDTESIARIASGIADTLDTNPPALSSVEIQEGSRLLRWLVAGHFTFLGYRRDEFVSLDSGSAEPVLHALPGSQLGVFHEDLSTREFPVGQTFPDPIDAVPRDSSNRFLVLVPSPGVDPVAHPSRPCSILVQTFSADGRVTGRHCFFGAFTRAAHHQDVLTIPVLDRRVRELVGRAGFSMASPAGRRMMEVLQNWPLTDLLSTDSELLYAAATGAVTLTARCGLRLFLRLDSDGNNYSCLVLLPRDSYSTATRSAIQNVLLAELEGTGVESSPRLGEDALAQIHFTVHIDPAAVVEPDTVRIQERLNAALQSWDDLMVDAVHHERRQYADAEANSVWQGNPEVAEPVTDQGNRVAALFPESYRQNFSPTTALADLRILDALSDQDNCAVSLYRADDTRPAEWNFKLFFLGAGVTLSTLVPLFQHMGVEVVDQRPYELDREDGTPCWIYDFRLWLPEQETSGLDTEAQRDLRKRFEEGFSAMWRGQAEADGFNALILRTELTWQQVAVLRAYCRYLRQAGLPYSQEYLENALLTHPEITTALVRLFETRFDPADENRWRPERMAAQTEEITGLIDDVTSLDIDLILRRLQATIMATLRTNHWVRDADGHPRPYLAFKLNPHDIPGVPEPCPMFETFVCSPRVEGTHLRFGSVSRGGLRWSERQEDYRTEVLGLVKAQAVKNALAVPAGAKGGFVVKCPPAPTGDPQQDRPAQRAEGIACYRLFTSGLLDLTDNLSAGEVVPAPGVVRHDTEDSYMVVAADKGTAGFSDIANEVSEEYDFWLGDAFASGGSRGYDHKAMAITARGAWESVKRHFRELGVDPQAEEITAVGIGDMAGDVFGNGMLRSNRIRLVAAFNHLHIFLDPDPDAAASYAERQRLFELPGSSWDDYDRSLISPGGGVYARADKSVPVSPEVRDMLGLPEGTTELAPTDLMHAILAAPVDLLWNGGIGTYVKATSESHTDVGDKANDSVRADGDELRARVVGEGGNLGFTQRARIEFAHNGGKINTDAIDNSAGVDSSDHEVNIKIMLDRLVAAGQLDHAQRHELLAEMTDEVADLVLAHNVSQNAVLGVSRSAAPAMLSVHRRLVSALEAKGILNRALEALPEDAGLAEREQHGRGLYSPELATILAHVKLDLKHELLDSDLPDAAFAARRLPEYFPGPIRDRYPEALDRHPLRRELTTTLVVNDVVDHAGLSYAFRLSEDLSVPATDAVRAYTIVTTIYGLHQSWNEIAALGQVPTGITDGMVRETRRLLDRAARWFLTNRPQPLAVDTEISRFAGVLDLMPELPTLLREEQGAAVRRHAAELGAQGVPEELAERISLLLCGYCLLDILEIAELAEEELGLDSGSARVRTAELYYALSERWGIDHMLGAVNGLECGNRWTAMARLALRDDLYTSLRAITLDVLRHGDPQAEMPDKITQWEQANTAQLARARATLAEIDLSTAHDLATLSVATRQIRQAVR